MITIRGGRLSTGERRDFHIAEGILVGDPPSGAMTVDAEGLIVIPGLVDMQINGAFGHDFTQDPTTIWEVGARLPELGVTTFLPTIVTAPGEVTDLAIDVVSGGKPNDYRGADVIGLHFEGPWISPEMHGAHNLAHIADPDPSVARRWAESGQLRLVTLAPERPGADTVIDQLTRLGVQVSVGHTAADYATTRRAFESGASLATHLFNQMTPLTHRAPGVVGAALLHARHCLLIVDGHHVADAALEVAWRVLGESRTILVTDAMAALGLGPGTYALGDGPITVGEDGPRTGDGRLAGSVVTLPAAIGNLTESTSADLHGAIRGATLNPAHALGLGDRGDLSHGRRADLTLLDDALNVVTTYVAGEVSHG
ncbi:MAG TPA: N-acetylglucosamine-6-phosphate deacetylase [Acidimicrobiia bacterium]|nr:N-acetylglucosamine-6-phosphate deacetylase [Acidimicrobiia bacterium]